MRWWIDIANAPNVTVFQPIANRLRERGDEITITVWDRGQTKPLVMEIWHDAIVVGPPGFHTPVLSKGVALASRPIALAREMHGRHVDIALGHASNAQVLAARMLHLPCINMMDYEHHPANHVDSARPISYSFREPCHMRQLTSSGCLSFVGCRIPV